jgi:hypothetical protein
MAWRLQIDRATLDSLEASKRMADEDLDLRLFVEMSVVLTGFSQVELLGTGMERTYLTTVREAVGGAVTGDLLRVFREVVTAGGDVETGLRVRVLGDPALGPVARNVISLWYMGNWYELPQSWQDAYGLSATDVTRVVSAESYQQGLVWTAADTHPQGAHQPGYGTWAEPPGNAKTL